MTEDPDVTCIWIVTFRPAERPPYTANEPPALTLTLLSYHIAVAVWGGMDYLLSWNFKHIVGKRTRDIVRMVNTLNRVGQVEIMTPAELL